MFGYENETPNISTFSRIFWILHTFPLYHCYSFKNIFPFLRSETFAETFGVWIPYNYYMAPMQGPKVLAKKFRFASTPSVVDNDSSLRIKQNQVGKIKETKWGVQWKLKLAPFPIALTSPVSFSLLSQNFK